MAEELTECANVIADWDKKMGEIRNRIERYSEEKTRACRQSDWHGSSIVTKKEPVDKIFQ